MPAEEDALFGQVAVELGHAAEQQVSDCLEAQKVTASVGINQTLGEIMVAKGILTRDALRQITREVMKRSGKRVKIGSYEVIAKLGQGGMGAVYKAELPATGAVVAIKVLPPELAKNRGFVERFRREAKIASELDHPNVVRAIDAGETGGYHYFAMEYVEGETVHRRLKREMIIPEGEALGIARQVALAVQHANDAGLIHRDIKPDNIFMTPDGQVKLGDLGLAREAGEDAAQLTQSGIMVGTPHYVSPEQARGERDIDVRTDIYSLGATLYHMVTGRVPFEGDTAMAVLNKHLSEELPWPADINEELTDDICMLIAKMMAKDPADRYDEPLALIAEIDRVIRGDAPSSGLIPVGKSSVQKAARVRDAAEAAERRRRRLEADARPSTRRAGAIAGASSTRMRPVKKSSAPVVIGAAAGVGMIAVAAFILLTGPDESTTAAGQPKPPERAGEGTGAPAKTRPEPERADPTEPARPPVTGRSVRPGRADFGNATVKDLGGGRVEAVWEFDRPLDPSAWYLRNVLPRDAKGAGLFWRSGDDFYVNRALAPRIAFEGDLDVEARFSSFGGAYRDAKRAPMPCLTLYSAEPGTDGKRTAVRMSTPWGTGARRWGPVKLLEKQWPLGYAADIPGKSLCIVKRGNRAERRYSTTADGTAMKPQGSESMPPGPVAVEVGLAHAYARSATACLERLKIVGKPVGVLDLPDAALTVPKKATASEQLAYAHSVAKATTGGYGSREAHEAFAAQILHFPESVVEMGREEALFRLVRYGEPGRTIELWDKVKGNFSQAQAVRFQCCLRVGEAYRQLGDRDSALRLLRPGRDADGDYALTLGSTHRTFGEYDDAIRELEHCLSKHPKYWAKYRALMMLGECHRAKGSLARALECYRRVPNECKAYPAECEKARALIAEIEKESAAGPAPRETGAASDPPPYPRSKVLYRESFDGPGTGGWTGAGAVRAAGTTGCALRLAPDPGNKYFATKASCELGAIKASVKTKICFCYRTEPGISSMQLQCFLTDNAGVSRNWHVALPPSAGWRQASVPIEAFEMNPGPASDISRGLKIGEIKVYGGLVGETGTCLIDDVMICDPPPEHAAVEPAPRAPVVAEPTPGRARLGAVLDEFDAFALRGLHDRAAAKIASAKREKALAGFSDVLSAAEKVAAELAAAKKIADSGLRNAVGREIEIDVGGKPQSCRITRVFDDAFEVEREVRMGGRRTKMSTRVKFSGLDPKALDALRGRYEPKTADGHVAAAILALSKKAVKAAEDSLGRAGRHPLVGRYEAKLAALRPKPVPARPSPAAPKVNLFADFTAAGTFFLDSRDGDDRNDGTRWSRAWKSFDKVPAKGREIKMVLLLRGRGAAHPYLSRRNAAGEVDQAIIPYNNKPGAHTTLVGVDDTGEAVLRHPPEAAGQFVGLRRYCPGLKAVNVRFEQFRNCLDLNPTSDTEWIGCRFVLPDTDAFVAGTIRISSDEAAKEPFAGMVVRDCLFVGGGGVRAEGRVASAVVEHCTFIDCYQMAIGSFLQALDLRSLAVTDCLFAKMAGAFSFKPTCKPATVRNCYMTADVKSVGDKRLEGAVTKIRDAGFANAAGGDYSLSPRSPLRRRATDGTDVGYRPAEGMKAATAIVCKLMGRPVAAAGAKILYREGWDKGDRNGWGLGEVVDDPVRGKVLAAQKVDKTYASYTLQSNWQPHIPVARGAYLSFWYCLERPSPSMTMHMANTVEGHNGFNIRLGQKRPLEAGRWRFFSIKLDDIVTPAGGRFETGDMCKQFAISGRERPAPRFMIDDVTISTGGPPPGGAGGAGTTGPTGSAPVPAPVKIGGVSFGHAAVRRLRGGGVEAVWEFDRPLDAPAWHLWNVLARDAGSGAVNMVLMKPEGSPCHPGRAVAPRVAFEGDMEVEAVFAGLSQQAAHGTKWPVPTVSLVSAAAGGPRRCARFPERGSGSGFTGVYWGEIAPAGKSLPETARGATEAVIRVVRKGGSVECFWSSSRSARGRSLGRVSLPAGPVGVDVGLNHVYAVRYTARLERLRIVGTPAGVLRLPDPVDAVPRKGSAAALAAHGLSIDSRTSPEALAVWRALIMRYPRSAKEVHKAFHSLSIYGAPAESVRLWEAKRGELDMAQAVTLGTHRMMATAYSILGMKDEAVECYKLGGLKSGFDLYGLGGLYHHYGDWENAIRYLEMDLAASADQWRAPTALVRLGDAYRATGNRAKALEAYRRVLAKWADRTKEAGAARKAIAELGG